ncbi:MAG: selenoneine biosynthesis selenosugar synthase SenB [Planctomycetota bacterium]|jgi:putative glycosyltransferase (TIGR04348 family)
MKPLRIRIACPAPSHSRYGNRITALRWSKMLRHLGHNVSIFDSGVMRRTPSADVLIALHALKSAGPAQAFLQSQDHGALVVALTGTDLYRDIRHSALARRMLESADRLIVLQERGLDELSARHKNKTTVMLQSAEPTRIAPLRAARYFRVMVIGHLRQEKDPFRAAMAVRNLPPSSRIRVEHYGAARQNAMAATADREMEHNSRYHWYDAQPRWKIRRRLARSRLLVLSSRIEGGAAVLGEAIVDGIPILASRIPCCKGMLGPDHAGLFPVGDTRALRRLLLEAEGNNRFYAKLREHGMRRVSLFHPQREMSSWEHLLKAIS